jgi:hypothetical protein
MNICIFLGPTLAVETARQELNAIFLPPAAHGDIYRATLRQPPPRAIGLIDGYFRQQPAVRHKEILWAMSQGIHVFGAASMGALRAAELADFGMNGVGRIFESLRDGTLEDDDEVAVDHGPADVKYLALNDAMVDIRVTFAAAVAEGIVEKATESALVGIAKQLFFTERTYATILERAYHAGLPDTDVKKLRLWLPTNRRSQKRTDAIALLSAIREFLIANPLPKKVTYIFQRTETWDVDVAFATPLRHSAVTETTSPFLSGNELLDELRLVPQLYQSIRQEALTRALVLREFRRHGLTVTEPEVAAAKLLWSRNRNLRTPEDILVWCRINHLDKPAFDVMITEEAIRCRLEKMAESLVDEHLLTGLRNRGSYHHIASRGLRKKELLATYSDEQAASNMSTTDLVAWYCEVRLERPLPDDINDFALQLGFADSHELHRALLREFLYEGAEAEQIRAKTVSH